MFHYSPPASFFVDPVSRRFAGSNLTAGNVTSARNLAGQVADEVAAHPNVAGSVVGRVMVCLAILAILYLIRIERRLKAVPEEVRRVADAEWTPELLKKTYEDLQRKPVDFTPSLPPMLDRRYVVVGGSGLVGSFMVLQLLARGHSTKSIRIIDLRQSERKEMLTGPVTEVEFIRTDISSEASVEAAFSREWHASVAKLPLTVFHMAAVIIPSCRSRCFYGFPERVNVGGTRNVLASAKRAGADIFIATSSASIKIKPIDAWVAPWKSLPGNFVQTLDTKDFLLPVRKFEEYFGIYPVSKAVSERLVCDANEDSFRTGAIRPANSVYGDPSDCVLGDPLGRSFLPTFANHIVQSFVHAGNVSLAHLDLEATLASTGASASMPQAGRPFVVTDPNKPISYRSLYMGVQALSVHPFRTVEMPTLSMLLPSYAVELYDALPERFPLLKRVLPKLRGDLKFLKPGLFSICTHLIADDSEARLPVARGGIGYSGAITTLDGVAGEMLQWNRDHESENGHLARKGKLTSLSLADTIRESAMGNLVSLADSITNSVSLGDTIKEIGAMGHAVAA